MHWRKSRVFMRFLMQSNEAFHARFTFAA